MSTIIANARVITPERIIHGGVEIEGDKIIRVFSGKAPEVGRVIDAHGDYLTPGFVDIHVHGKYQAQFSYGTPEKLNEATRYFGQNGTTSIVPTFGSNSPQVILNGVKNVVRAMEEGNDGARVIGAHLEGCYFNPKCAGAQNPAYLFSPKPENYMPLVETGAILRISASPEIDGALEMARRLAPQGILMSVGHSDANYEDMMNALDAGYTHVTHIYNALSMLSSCYYYPAVGACETALLHDEFTIEAICDGRHVPPQLLRLMYRIKGPDRFHAITDSVYAGAANGTRIEAALPSKVENDVCVLADDSCFDGSIATTDRLLRTLVFDAQIPICDAVKMLTLTPAKQVRANDIGRIAVGMRADLNLFGDDLQIKKTWIGGKEYH